jgi:hypothetical protein
MDNVADCQAYAADQVVLGVKMVQQGLKTGFVRYQELYVVSGGKTEIPFAELVCDVADVEHPVTADKARRGNTYGVNNIAAVAGMFKNAGTWNFMCFPVAVVLGDYRWKQFPEIWWSKICTCHY